MSWELHSDLASLLLAGNAAILMEVLHPSVMDGVYTHSSYRTAPTRRARNTLGYLLRTTFGSSQAATSTIEAVKAMHARVEGSRPDGVRYRALDPELIGWVHTCIPWAVMGAFERTKRRLSVDEKNRYLLEQAVIGRMGGAGDIPETTDELVEYVEQMRPKLAMTSQTVDFLGFLAARVDRAPAAGFWERLDAATSVRSSMRLMPPWARRLTGTLQPEWMGRLLLEPLDRRRAELVRWAYPAPPCVAMAHARVARRAGPERPRLRAASGTTPTRAQPA